MEGVDEPLARLVETAYVNEAARAVTAAMVSRGERPSVISALMKYQTTEKLRQRRQRRLRHPRRPRHLRRPVELPAIGLSAGARRHHGRRREHSDPHADHLRARALRSHPYLYKEVQAVQDPTASAAWPPSKTRSSAISRSRSPTSPVRSSTTSQLGMFGEVPDRADGWRPIYRQLSRASRNFALVADLTVAHAWRRPQGEAENHRPPGGCALRDLPAVLRPETLRG